MHLNVIYAMIYYISMSFSMIMYASVLFYIKYIGIIEFKYFAKYMDRKQNGQHKFY